MQPNNPDILRMIDLIALSFDTANCFVAPVVTIEFANEGDLNRYLDKLHRELINYSENGIVARVKANEVVKLNDVLLNFKVRSQ